MSVYKSAPLKFIGEGQSFYVHEDLLAKHSEPLHDMVTKPGMKEAEQKYAVLEEVTAPTFERFLEWVYKAHYTPAEPRKEASEADQKAPTKGSDKDADSSVEAQVELLEEPAADSPITISEPEHEWPGSGWTFPIKKAESNSALSELVSAKSRKSRDSFMSDFVSTEYTEYRTSVPVAPIRGNSCSTANFTEVFLSHARVYVFADQYLINDLKTLALEMLHQTLKLFDLTKRRAGDVLALIEYIYRNTAPGSGASLETKKRSKWKQEKEPLRNLLVKYMGYQMDTLMKDPKFALLLVKTGKGLTKDFLRVVEQRI